MRGNILIKSTTKGFKVNGIKKTYIAGGNIKRGKFVKIVEGKIQQIESERDQIIGITKTIGKEGKEVQVYIPKYLRYLITEEGNQIITEREEKIRNE